MDLKLKDKVVLITGGAVGIGADVVKAFVDEGSNVVIADWDQAAAQRMADSYGDRVMALACDVSKTENVDKVVSTVISKYGKIDVLVNNAGVHRNLFINDLRREDWDLIISVNLTGVFLMCKAVVPHMQQAKYGKIVNMASVAGKQGYPGHLHYSASKFGVIGMTQVLAAELGQDNINVNAVCPGIVMTPLQAEQVKSLASRSAASTEAAWGDLIKLTLLKRPQTGEDMANAVLFLSSDVSANITGEAMNVSGGIRMD